MKAKRFIVICCSCMALNILLTLYSFGLNQYTVIDIGLSIVSFGLIVSAVRDRRKLGSLCSCASILLCCTYIFVYVNTRERLTILNFCEYIPLFLFHCLYGFGFNKEKAQVSAVVVASIGVGCQLIINIALNLIMGYRYSFYELIHPFQLVFRFVIYLLIASWRLGEIRKASNKMMKNKTTAILLSVLLGGLGIDRFYLGYIGMGILKLFTAGGFGILYIYDIITICTGSLKPADGFCYEESEKTVSPITTEPVAALEKLAKLHEQGVLSDDEFNQKKKELLSKI